MRHSGALSLLILASAFACSGGDARGMGFAMGPGLDAALPAGCAFFYAGDANNNANRQSLEAAGIDGETCGGEVITGWVRTRADLGAALYVLAIDGLTVPNFTTTGDLTQPYGIPLYANPATTDADFQFTTTCSTTRTGGSRVCTTTTVVTGGATLHMTTTWADSTTPIYGFRLKIVATSNGNEINAAALQPTIATVNLPTQMCWKALGNP